MSGYLHVRRTPRRRALDRALIWALVPPGLLGSWIAYNRLWWHSAERAIAIVVQRTALGQPIDAITSTVAGGGRLHPAEDFRRSYALIGADHFLAGSSLSDLVGPGVLVAHARFANGHTYHVEAQRIAGRWHVVIEPAEGSPD